MIYIINNENIIYNAFLDYISKKITFNNEEHNFDIIKMNNKFSSIYQSLNYILLINNIYYYTEDSLLYLPLKLKNIYKKKFLIHHEWNDQIILNYYNKNLFRIEKNQEISSFEDKNNKIIIYWNNINKETFFKIDNYSYASSYIYNIYQQSLLKVKSIFLPIYIFMHVCCIENWKEIYLDQINTIKQSGLYEKVDSIYVGILGEFDKNDFEDSKIKILYTDYRTNFYEIKTINYMKGFLESSEIKDAYILYIHTKGVRNAGNKETIKSWRKMMEYFLIECHEKCLTFLEDYDTLGCNVINKGDIRVNKDHAYHYSGNFWWSKKSYIKNLPYLDIELSQKSVQLRFRGENWILSAYPNTKVGVLFQDNTNIHPYNKYVFDYYKEMKFFVKNLLEWNKENI